ncbi:unnamed protein product, partial [Ectocarpus sp. 12 AP-2014]
KNENTVPVEGGHAKKQRRETASSKYPHTSHVGCAGENRAYRSPSRRGRDTRSVVHRQQHDAFTSVPHPHKHTHTHTPKPPAPLPTAILIRSPARKTGAQQGALAIGLLGLPGHLFHGHPLG